MLVAIAGSSGFVGKRLKQALLARNFSVIDIRRQDFTGSDSGLAERLTGAQVIINLAGAPIIQKWTTQYKRELYESRILTARKIRKAVCLMPEKPRLLIGTSAVGIYPDGKVLNESDREFTPNFLSNLCRDWEDEVLTDDCDYRRIIFRLGIVLDPAEGAFPRIVKPFRVGVGGKLGSGRQGFSWIHLQDLIRAYFFVMENTECQGIFNLTAPNPVSNAQFTRMLAQKLNRPAIFPVPRFALKLLYGEGSMALTEGQLVMPGRLLDSGFTFAFPDLDSCLNDLVKK